MPTLDRFLTGLCDICAEEVNTHRGEEEPEAGAVRESHGRKFLEGGSGQLHSDKSRTEERWSDLTTD